MPPRISLALAIHNHQPVGNFGWVFAEVYEQAYRPMVDALERHPSVHLSLHYTGPLLEWFRRERPEFLERLRALVARGQVELLGGAYYEPVLASLPEHDRLGQLRRMADEIEALSGTRPRGAWLAERVWEPSLPSTLADGGYRWTIVDDNHFKAAAIPNEALWGAYTTEDQGRLLNVFGTEQGLRYLIPFRDVDEVIGHLRNHATDDGSRLGMMGDDGEKFGGWPTTFEHCWGSRQWMERFFRALEDNASWLTTTTPSAWLERRAPIGRVYLPTASYAEMGEWALPATESRLYSHFLHEVREAGRPEADWLRGGFWRNFQVKYREINDLHKQMLRASAKVAAMAPGPDRERALDHLYRGQSNDCYWHGLFGGIYIGHMRLATYEHLIAAEDIADESARVDGDEPDGARLVDVDLDGIDEAFLSAPGQSVAVKLDEGAGIGSWDIRAVRHAVLSIMRRRPEAYHARLVEHERSIAARLERASGDAAASPGRAKAGGDGAAANPDGVAAGAPASIHDIVAVKEEGLAARLHYDAYERRSGLVRFLDSKATVADLAGARAVELGDFVAGAFELVSLADDCVVVERHGAVVVGGEKCPVVVTKSIALAGDRAQPRLSVDVHVTNRSDRRVEARLGVEWSLMLLGGGGNPAAYYELDGERTAHDAGGVAQAVTSIRSGNEYVGIDIETRPSPAADAWWYPIETISNSEAGFERVYQGSCLVFTWPVALEPGADVTVRVEHVVSAERDRAIEEAAAAAAVG